MRYITTVLSILPPLGSLTPRPRGALLYRTKIISSGSVIAEQKHANVQVTSHGFVDFEPRDVLLRADLVLHLCVELILSDIPVLFVFERTSVADEATPLTSRGTWERS